MKTVKIYSEDLTRESVAWNVFIRNSVLETELVSIRFTS